VSAAAESKPAASPHTTPAAQSAPRRNWLTAIPRIVLAAIMFVVMADLLIGVFLRYIVVAVTDYFDWPTVSFFWVEEVGEFGLAWLVAIGAAVAIIERTHFALAVFTHRFSAHTRRVIDRVNHAAIAGFGVLVAVYGWKIAMLNTTLESPGLSINLAWLYASSVAGGTLIAVYGFAVAFGIVQPAAEPTLHGEA
jgi:TRAP-type C4-dicarboxylate transport system permease small subunit